MNLTEHSMPRLFSYAVLLVLLVLAGCSTGRNATMTPAEVPSGTPALDSEANDYLQDLVYDATPPPTFLRAVDQDTRTETGRPGDAYWQQDVAYTLRAHVFPEEKRLIGSGQVRYTNNAPQALEELHLELAQNLHAPGVVRTEPAEVTGGIDLRRVVVNGRELETGGRGPRYGVFGTQLVIAPPAPVQPGETVTMELDWAVSIPQRGAGARMGYSEDDLLYLGYWYPVMSVYDDVNGWYTDPFTGGAEFYADHADYDVTVRAPSGWLVMATGALENADEVLAPQVLQRMRQAYESDDPVMIATPETTPLTASDDTLQWQFGAERVRDVAFHLSRGGFWEGARTPVGDRDGDGQTDYTHINTFWRQNAPLWSEVTRYQQHSITFESDYTGFPYPWPHMTAVEGGGIIGGGMEFPMMTIMGDYNQRGDSALYYVTAHELAHMWVPMIVSTNERLFSWMDEGMTTFLENEARKDFFPGPQHFAGDQAYYMSVAGSGFEGEIMRRSDYHYPGPAFVVASYMKPATLLRALKGVLGEEVFHQAYQMFIDDWAFKHPYPHDFFNTFERVSGQDLDWFWRSWYYETWTLDQAVTDVRRQDGRTQIVIENEGRVPMPVLLNVRLANGETIARRVPVDVWLDGTTRTTVTLDTDAAIESVEIDPERYFPDVDPGDNVWQRSGSMGG